NQVVSVGADIAFDADPKFFACLVRFESSSVPTTLPTAYDVYPLDGRHDGGYYTVKDCVTIDVLPRTPGNNVYVRSEERRVGKECRCGWLPYCERKRIYRRRNRITFDPYGRGWYRIHTLDRAWVATMYLYR